MVQTNDLEEQESAWNRFISNVWDSPSLSPSNPLRNAGIAGLFMMETLNGGLYQYLLNRHEIGGKETVEALMSIGAIQSARHLMKVLRTINIDLTPSKQFERDYALDCHWTDESSEFETLPEEATLELENCLQEHVKKYLKTYLQKPDGNFSKLDGLVHKFQG